MERPDTPIPFPPGTYWNDRTRTTIIGANGEETSTNNQAQEDEIEPAVAPTPQHPIDFHSNPYWNIPPPIPPTPPGQDSAQFRLDFMRRVSAYGPHQNPLPPPNQSFSVAESENETRRWDLEMNWVYRCFNGHSRTVHMKGYFCVFSAVVIVGVGLLAMCIMFKAQI